MAFALTLLLAALQPGFDQYLASAKKAEAAGDFHAAEKEYEKALAMRADGEIFQRLGLVRHMQNEFARAIPAFEKAIRLRPDLWGAYLFFGIDCYRTNQFPKALTALTRAAKLQPAEPEVQFWLGTTHIALKHYLDGQEILEELSKRQPENLEALRILAQSYSDYAVALHNRVAAEHPESAWAFRIHGQALESEGFCEAALAEYRKAQALKPDMEGLRESIERCQAKH
jgi:tetratricopeptide (TPR) repeat protein